MGDEPEVQAGLFSRSLPFHFLLPLKGWKEEKACRPQYDKNKGQ